MTILKKLVVKTGSYEKGGKTVGRYETVGHVHSGEHGDYITLKACINFAAFPRRDGDDRVMVSMFDPDASKEAGKEGIKKARAAAAPFKDDEDW